MIGIRADANEIVATGHIMRCITIAKQVMKFGEEVIFFLADVYGVSMLEENGLHYHILHTDWKNPKEELTLLCYEIESRGITAMLFDSYRMDREYFVQLHKKLARKVRLAYLDDLFEAVYPVDVLINYNAYYRQFPYENAYQCQSKAVLEDNAENRVQKDTEQMIQTKTRLCLGPAYVPLREEFSKRKRKKGSSGNILLSCGGGDQLQSLYGILDAALQDIRFQECVFHVIVGRFHQRKELLEQLAERYASVILHPNVTAMAQLMEECEIAVSAAGTMLYELCAMERPTVFFITADNQRYDSDFFAEDERMIFAGEYRNNKEICIAKILSGMHLLLTDEALQEAMKRKLRDVTDGSGAERIAEILLGR